MMSTLIYDGEFVVSDSRMVHGGTYNTDAKKIFHVVTSESERCIFGIVGLLDAGRLIVEKNLCDIWRPDTCEAIYGLYPESDDNRNFTFMAIDLVTDKNTVWEYSRGNRYSVPFPPPYTLGSGYQIAAGALAAGATGMEAVSIAASLDTNTDTKLQVFDVNSEIWK